MAQPPTNPRIEELQARFKADPKSRHFYPLGEELRKVGRTAEAEEILRTGLAANPNYLSAWVSLGRTLKELGRYQESTEALARALVVDPGNVVAARLAGESFLAMGDKVEAIKKFKLARAMLPSDEMLEEQIDQLERELNPVLFVGEGPTWEQTAEVPVPRAPDAVEAAAAGSEPVPFDDSEESPFESTAELPVSKPAIVKPAIAPVIVEEAESPFESTQRVIREPAEIAAPFFDRFTDESGTSAEVVSPFEESVVAEPAPAAGADGSPRLAAEPFASGDELIATSTMADLYARQGHFDSARRIYERILDRDASNGEVRAKLEALPARGGPPEASRNETVVRLEGWLKKVGRRADGGL